MLSAVHASKSLVVGWVVGLLTACGEAPTFVVEPGRIEYFERQPRVIVPLTVQVNEPFGIAVTTYGGGCIDFDSTAVEQSDDTADVTPLDRRETNASLCTLELVEIPHEETLLFQSVGNKTIRVHGTKVSSRGEEELNVEISVLVE